MHHRSVAILSALLSIPLCLAPAGCNVLGAVAGKVAPEPIIEPQYAGFTNQSIAVMVWAGEGTMIDFPDVRTDVAGSLQNKLKQAEQVKTKQLAGITFPTAPAAVVRLQENHPEYEAMPLVQVAPK